MVLTSHPLCRSSFTRLALAGALALVACGCSKAIREKALREHSEAMCGSVDHEAGTACATEVGRRFPRCSPGLLEHKISAEAYARCLGFIVAPVASASPTRPEQGE